MMDRERIEGERAQEQTGSIHSRTALLYRAGAVSLLAGTAVAVTVWYAAHVRAHVADAPAARRASRADGTSEMKLPPIAVPHRAAPPAAVVERADGAGTTSEPPAAQGRAAPHSVGGDAGNQPMRESTRPSASAPVLVRTSVATPPLPASADAVTAPAWTAELSAAAGWPDAAPRSTLNRAETRPLATAEATLLPDRRFLLPKGSFLGCTLETAIDSTLPGLATCVLATDVYGGDGRVVLMERGTRLIGEVRADVRAGQSRVAILWEDARTPAGVQLALASQATDGLGRAGVPGVVDRHLTERFGAAVLLSFIDAAASAIVARQQAPGSIVYSPQASTEIATEALRGSIGIPPTIRIPPGAQIQVIVAADVNFRNVYRLADRDAR
jgi:type IV secretion system protein VirB10